MKQKNINKIIGAGESTTIEWKQSVAAINEIIETAAAFTNTEGGRIFVGISLWKYGIRGDSHCP